MSGGARAFSSALRGAGVANEDRMDLDGGVGRAGRGRRGARSNGPLDQSGRRSRDAPYAKPDSGSLASRISGGPSGSAKGKRRGANLNPGGSKRLPEGTPDGASRAEQVRRQQHSKLNEVIRGDEIKQWLRSRLVAPGIVNMSDLANDPWLKEHGIAPPGSPEAPANAGHVFWKLIQTTLETPENRIVTMSLAHNGFKSLHQLSKLPLCLPYIRALDLSNNPIAKSDELKHLQSPGEQKGKASSAAGSLKSLVELKLEGTKFREEMLQRPDGGEKYQHDILRRFPGLLILDSVQLNRIVFPLERRPIVKRTEEERKALATRSFSYPIDVTTAFEENEACQSAVMDFCGRFFPLWDSNRAEAIDFYHPEATISISANTLPSRSAQATELAKSRSSRPQPVSFEAWVTLPGRNFFRSCTTVEQRVKTLKSPMDQAEFLRWLTKSVPDTKHPIHDASKWSIDAWYFDTNNDRISAVIQGEFQELPSMTYRSFTRTFILAASPPGTAAATKGYPCVILSDTMIVHSYLGSTGSWDNKATLVKGDITIVPPVVGAVPIPAVTVTAAPGDEAAQKAAMVEQVRQQTGMNAQFSELCLAQNGWDVERAVVNFQEIRATIPPEAFQ